MPGGKVSEQEMVTADELTETAILYVVVSGPGDTKLSKKMTLEQLKEWLDSQ